MIAQTKAALRRLAEFLGNFETCFVEPAQRGGLQRYVEGLCGPSGRKSMARMWASLENPGKYQALQHFITTAPWDEGSVWKALRSVIPERRGIVESSSRCGRSFSNENAVVRSSTIAR